MARVIDPENGRTADTITPAAIIRYVVEASVSITAAAVHHHITQSPVSAVMLVVITSGRFMVTAAVVAVINIIKLLIIPIFPPFAAMSADTRGELAMLSRAQILIFMLIIIHQYSIHPPGTCSIPPISSTINNFTNNPNTRCTRQEII